tara:strand:+ start:1082 stop:1708 length:627 start_codon:yes stop_codon:yes gene_type:complete
MKFVNRTYAIVLARKNSKRITSKNTILFKNKPLIEWTFEEARKSKHIFKILCSTDDGSIISRYKNLDKIEFPFKRPKYLSKNSTTSEDTIKHLLNFYLKKNNYLPRNIILLQPTSPLRTVKHINKSLIKYRQNKCCSLISITKISHTYKTINSRLKKIKNIYKFNGAIFIFDTKKFLNTNKIYQSDCTYFYKMDEKSSLDLDYPHQLV